MEESKDKLNLRGGGRKRAYAMSWSRDAKGNITKRHLNKTSSCITSFSASGHTTTIWIWEVWKLK